MNQPASVIILLFCTLLSGCDSGGGSQVADEDPVDRPADPVPIGISVNAINLSAGTADILYRRLGAATFSRLEVPNARTMESLGGRWNNDGTGFYFHTPLTDAFAQGELGYFDAVQNTTSVIRSDNALATDPWTMFPSPGDGKWIAYTRMTSSTFGTSYMPGVVHSETGEHHLLDDFFSVSAGWSRDGVLHVLSRNRQRIYRTDERLVVSDTILVSPQAFEDRLGADWRFERGSIDASGTKMPIS